MYLIKHNYTLVLCFFLGNIFCAFSAFSQLKNPKKAADSLVTNKFDAVKKKVNFDDKLKKISDRQKAAGDSLKKNKPVDLSNLVLENSTMLTGNRLAISDLRALNNFSVFGQVKVFGFPLAIDFATNAAEFQHADPLNDGLFKMGFDQAQYQQSYKNELEKYTRFKKNQLSGLEISDYLKKEVSKSLQSVKDVNLPDYPKLNALLNSKEQVSALLAMDENQIKARIEELMSTEKQTGLSKADSLSQNTQFKVQQEIDKKKALVTDQVLELKHKINDNGLDQQRLILIQKFIANKGNLNDIGAIFENEMNQSRASGVSRFYSKIRNLQAGDFSQKMPGSFLNQDQMMKGANFTLRTGRGPVNVGMGLSKDGDMPKDANFTNSMYDSRKILTYLSVPTGNFIFGSGKISWIGSFDQQGKQGLNQMNAMPKNGLSFVVSQDLRFNSVGKFTLEISKSSIQYKNISVSEPDKLALNQDLRAGNYLRDDFLETMSFGLKHNIELKKFGLVSNTFFSYSGAGHQNPGQLGYSNMGMRLGGNLKKSMLRNKVVLSMRTDIKNTPISALSGAHWRNYNFSLDSRFKVSKHYSFNLKYAENGVNKVEAVTAAIYASKKLQADMSSNYKVGSSYGLSNLSVGTQSMLNPATSSRSEFATAIYSQTFVLNAFSVSGNALYNKELSGKKILGDMLNADAGVQYTLFRNLSVSSALTYLDNQNVARQAGVRQSMQVTVLKNFDLSAFVDVRKNLISPLYPDLFSTGRGEVSIRYYLRK